MKGKIKLTVVSRQGKEAVIAILSAGDFFGEGCLAGQPKRMSTVTALTVGAVFVLAVLDNIFNQLGVDPFLKQVVRGVVIVAAVAVYARRRHTAKARPPAAGPMVTPDAPSATPTGGEPATPSPADTPRPAEVTP